MSKGSPKVSVRLDRDFYEWINRYTKEIGRDKSEVIREALTAYRTALTKQGQS